MAGPIARSSNLQFFLTRVDEARAQAEAATLDHVRERCRRSEAAWMALADKARRSEQLRIEETQRKAAVAATMTNEDNENTENNENAYAPEIPAGPPAGGPLQS